MRFVLIPATAYLALYAPGHYLLRGRSGDQPDSGSRLFREILLSACCTSWFGLVLAELNIYSLPAVLGCLTAVSFAAALLSRKARPGAYRSADLAGVVVLVLSWLWVAPPYDTRILGSDSAGYLASGAYLSRHNSLIIHDPTLPLLAPDLKRRLFPSVTHNPGSPPYLRLAGSLVLRSLDSDEVLPAFHPLLAVWIAVFHALAGSAAAQWVVTLFAGLSLWAMVEFAAALGGGVAALTCFLLLCLSSVQVWYSRFLMPEIPAQFFVWGGLLCLAFCSRTRAPADAALAGIAFGVAALMRLENAPLLFVALTAVLWQRDRIPLAHRLLLGVCAAAIWTHAAVHLITFRTHYLGNLLSLFPETAAIFSQAPRRQIVLLVAGLAVVVAWSRRRGSGLRTLVPALAPLVCVSLWADWRNGWYVLTLLTSYIGVPTLVCGGIGLLWWTGNLEHRGLARLGLEPQVRRDRSPLGRWDRLRAEFDSSPTRSEHEAALAERLFLVLAAVTFAQVMIAPHAAPVPIWTVRRAATIVLPVFCLGVGLLCYRVARRWHWPAAVALCSLALAGQALPFAKLGWEPYYQGGLRHIRAVAALLPFNAALLFDSQLTGWGFAPALWAERDLPAYIVLGNDPRRITTLLRSLNGMRLYWISNGILPPPRIPGIAVRPLALYEFALLTPSLDFGTSFGTDNVWDSTVAIYSLHVSQEGTAATAPPGG